MQLILASASIGREYLLKGLKIPYRVLPSGIDEDKITGKNLVETIKLRAKLKGEKVSQKIENSKLKIENCLILSADTEVILGNKLLGKPKDYGDAVRMLKMLSGKTHEVISGFYLVKIATGDASAGSPMRATARQSESEHAMGLASGRTRKLRYKLWSGYDHSFVTFRKLTDLDIKLYLSITDYTRYTGSYALIASPQNFITKIEGSISNVIGLPLEKVIPIFRENKLL